MSALDVKNGVPGYEYAVLNEKISYTLYMRLHLYCMPVKEFDYASLRYEAPIIYITFKSEVNIGFFEIRELVKAAEQLSGYKPYYTLCDITRGVHLTPRGRMVAADPKEAPLRCGVAVLVHAKMLDSAANMLGSSPPPFPFKVFSVKEQALTWLRSLPSPTRHPGDHDQQRA